VVDRDTFTEAFARESARVFEYCRGLVGRDDLAARLTETALRSARSMLQEPERLRAWLAVADSQPTNADPGQGIQPPDGREVFELVYRHGIHRADVAAVLGVSTAAASALLAAAEIEFGRPEQPAEPAEPDPATDARGPADPMSGQPVLPDPDRLRAWLFAVARREALTVGSSGPGSIGPGSSGPGSSGPAASDTAALAPAGAGLARYPAGDSAAAGANQEFPPASWWQGSVGQSARPTRRLRVAALTAVPLAAAIGVAVYLGGASRPVGSSAPTRTGGAAVGSAGRLRPVQPTARSAVSAPLASASPTDPAPVPASTTPVVPPPTSPPPSTSPTPKPSATPTPKPSSKPSPTPKPSATPTPKPSATPTPKPTPKPSATPTSKSTPTAKANPS
jgi:hypothetical protein